jgi:hypothetical protein
MHYQLFELESLLPGQTKVGVTTSFYSNTSGHMQLGRDCKLIGRLVLFFKTGDEKKEAV